VGNETAYVRMKETVPSSRYLMYTVFFQMLFPVIMSMLLPVTMSMLLPVTMYMLLPVTMYVLLPVLLLKPSRAPNYFKY